MINKEDLKELLEDLLQECFNDLYEYEDTEQEKADLIYDSVKLFTLKLKDRLEDLI